MSVLQMQRIHICTLKSNKEAILERLQHMGMVEVQIFLEDSEVFETQDVSQIKLEFGQKLRMLDRAMETMDVYAPEKKKMLDALEGKSSVEEWKRNSILETSEHYFQKAEQILQMDQDIHEFTGEIQNLNNQIEVLEPWMAMDIPMNFSETARTKVFIGTMAGNLSRENVLEILQNECCEVEIVSKDSDFTYLVVWCMKADAMEIEEKLRASGFVKPAQICTDIPINCKKEYLDQMAQIKERIEILKENLRQMASDREAFKILSDALRIKRDQYEILGQLPQTEKAMGLSGYIPKKDGQRIKETLLKDFEAVVELEDLEKEEEGPVLLSNGSFGEAGEGVLESFGLPRKGEMDPTWIMTGFYVFLFGLMLADAAYGLIIALVCGWVLKKYPAMENNLKKSLKLFFWCGVSTLIWGVLFGGYFGDAVSVISRTFFGHEVSIPALWFVPLNEPMRMLLWSLIFGMIHMYVGLFLKAYMCIRDHRYKDAIYDVGLWFMLLTGLILLLVPSDIFKSMFQLELTFPIWIGTVAKIMIGMGAIGLLLMSGRDKKGRWGIRLALGAYDLYNITGWLSDVLSYSRLLALGLATGVIASVFNQMGSMFGGGIFGAIIFAIVFVIGHVFNLAINLLGAYVHTCRLQYVEFFGKFYEGGGRPFRPFRLNTKYVDFKEEK